MSHWIDNAIRDTEAYSKNTKISCKDLKSMLEVRELDLEIYNRIQDWNEVDGYSIYVRELKRLVKDVKINKIFEIYKCIFFF